MWRFMLIGWVIAGCGDGGKRPLGGNCTDADDCASALCYLGTCLDPEGDNDGDSLTNQVELSLGTNPYEQDSDGDFALDGAEVGDLDDLTDTDGDGVVDALESAIDDADGDCVADQFDPDDRDERTERALSVCQRIGLCATYSDQLSATCDLVDGAPTWRCDPSDVPGYNASDAACDDVDEDCDGATDEDYVPTDAPCEAGACTASAPTRCVDGAVQSTCVTVVAGDDATCDGVDDDCDGATDEDFPTTATTCGVGACAEVGMRQCDAGEVVDDCVAGEAAADDSACNGEDDDCDGVTDEDTGPRAVSCGEGACRGEGIATCEDGEAIVDCEALDVAAPDDATCDGIDGDCDGDTDEDYEARASTCGVGACAAAGVVACVDGAPVDGCVAGVAAANDASCNDVDEDCNGVADEDYAVSATTCGIGACATIGSRVCAGGEVIDTCVPLAAAADDVTCDGVDDDCDGATDEAFTPYVSSCGRGACVAAGTVVCNAGVPSDDCAPNEPPSADDVVCDGVDSNCNGQTDEGYVPTPTSCGTGACAGSGVTTCEGGVIGDTCTAGSGELRDEDCDDIDDDCDGTADEDYVPSITRCGVGGCEREGELGCFEGVTVDSCEPGTGSADTDCDGVDDDCDGSADESYSVSGTNCGSGRCATTGQTSCVAGDELDSCVPLPGDCAGRQCGSDGCDGTCGTCPATPASCVTVTCSTGGQCLTTVNAGFCYIGGACITTGTVNPDNDCQLCEATTDATGWSPQKRGTICADEGNTCTSDICDGGGTCGHLSRADFSTCNDSNAATIADWCISTSCRGFFSKVEPKAGPGTEPLYFEHYRRGANGPSPSVAGQFYYINGNGDSQAAVAHYSTGNAVLRAVLDPSTSLVALGGTRLVQGDRMWELAGDKWLASRDNNTLRSVWGYDGDEFPSSFERIISFSIIGRNFAVGAGRNAGDGGLVMRSCSNYPALGIPWSCSGQEVFTGDFASYPVQIVRANSVNYLFANAGTSRTTPTATKVLTYSNGAWRANAALTRTTTSELKDVVYGGGWFIGVGASTLWVTKLAGNDYTNISIPGGAYVWQQAVIWRGHVVALGQQGTTTTTAVLAYCPLDDALNVSSRWQVHTLWSGQTNLATALAAPNDNELYVLGGDRLSAAPLSSTVRAVWRYTTNGVPIP